MRQTILALLLAAPWAVSVPAPADIIVSDGQTVLHFSRAKGALVSLTRSPHGRQLIVPEPDWWSLQLHDRTLRPSEANSFLAQQKPDETVLAWRFTALKLRVEVRLKPQPKAQGIAARWSARSEQGDNLRVEEIYFPKFRASSSLEKVTRPYTSLDDPHSADGASRRGLYPGNFPAMQFFVSWGGGPDGFYVGAHDPAATPRPLSGTTA